jgi:tetratricopeptide (TPR) repeat protein
VRFLDDRVRVYTELASVPQGVVVWSKAYENVAADYLGTQRDISQSIASGLNAELGVDIESSPRGDVSLSAYTFFLNGRFLSKLRGEQPLLASIDAFSKALQIEPDFDGARLGLANSYALLPYYSARNEDAAFAEAAEQLGRLQDPDSAEANAIRGFIAFRQWRWHEAEQLFRASLARNPDIANTHVWYSQFLSAVGRNREALQYAQSAYKLDSVSAVANDRLATAHLWLNHDEQARRLYEAGANLGFVNRLNPGYLNLMLRYRNFAAVQQALRALHPDGNLEPLISRIDDLDDPEARQELIDVTARMIDGDVLLPRLEFGWWVILKDWSRAAGTIEKYVGNKKNVDVEFLFARECDEFRGTGDFRKITRRIGLEAYWQEATPDFRLASAGVE